MNKEVLERIDALASKLNTTTEHLWNVMVRQARVEIIEISIGIPLLLLLLYGLYRLMSFLFRRSKEEDDHPLFIIGMMFTGLMMVACVVVIISGLFDLPTLIMNPEYWALNEIMEALGGKK